MGVHIIRALQDRYTLPEGLELIDGGTMGLDLLPFIEDKDHLLIVDAVDFNAEPGTIRTLQDSDIKKFLDMKFSVHQIGLPEMLFAASLQGILPPVICLVGIQPKSLDTSVELSETLTGRFDELMDTVVAKLQEWGIKLQEAKH